MDMEKVKKIKCDDLYRSIDFEILFLSLSVVTKELDITAQSNMNWLGGRCV